MSTAPTRTELRGTRCGRPRRAWPFAVAGLALLATSVTMMTAGAQESRAQTTRQHLGPSRPAPLRLAPLRLPAPAGRYQVGTVALHLIDRSGRTPVASPPYRELMISVSYPARDAARYPVAPQMLPAAAAHFGAGATAARLFYNVPPDKVNWAATLSHARTGAPVQRDGGVYAAGAGPGSGQGIRRSSSFEYPLLPRMSA